MLNGLLVGNALALALYFYVFTPAPAHAYFDLGVGTYMMQLVFGVGAAFFLSFRQQLMRRFGKAKPVAETAPEEAASPPESKQ